MTPQRPAPVGVVVALPVEARAFGTRIPRNGSADLGGNLVMTVCGVGVHNARVATERLLARPLAGLVSWGTAGALAPALTSGACLLPAAVCGPEREYETHARWRSRLAERLAMTLEPHDGALYSAGRVVATPAEKRSLHEQTGAVAVDVESATIAELARHAHMPFVCIRAVLDTAGTALPAVATDALGATGYPEPMRVARSLLRRPQQLRAAWQLAQQLRAARRTLRAVVRDSGPRLLGP